MKSLGHPGGSGLVDPDKRQALLASFASTRNGQRRNRLPLAVYGALRFERVVSVERRDFDGYFYDFSIEGAESYLAGVNGAVCLTERCRIPLDAVRPKPTERPVVTPVDVTETVAIAPSVFEKTLKYRDRLSGHAQRLLPHENYTDATIAARVEPTLDHLVGRGLQDQPASL